MGYGIRKIVRRIPSSMPEANKVKFCPKRDGEDMALIMTDSNEKRPARPLISKGRCAVWLEMNPWWIISRISVQLLLRIQRQCIPYHFWICIPLGSQLDHTGYAKGCGALRARRIDSFPSLVRRLPPLFGFGVDIPLGCVHWACLCFGESNHKRTRIIRHRNRWSSLTDSGLQPDPHDISSQLASLIASTGKHAPIQPPWSTLDRRRT